MDHDHLRFFTRRNIIDLFEFAGLRIRALQPVPGAGYAEWHAAGRPGEVRAGQLCVSGLPQEDAEEFFVYQYLVTAVPARTLQSGHASAPGAHVTSLRPVNDSLDGPATMNRGEAQPIGPMRFSQDFIADFEQFDFEGAPFAFVRFGDGERAIAMGKAVAVLQDGWAYDGRNTPLVDAVNASLRYSAPDYYIGISDSCCDRASQQWYLGQIQLPLQQITFANIFVNWNYRRFVQLDLAEAVVVASSGADFTVPENIILSDFDLDGLVSRLLSVDRPILVAAGPASSVIIHKYWQRATNKQTIVDVGSAIDERTKGRKTRSYQSAGSRTAELICHW